jgi:hypothetical protein
LSDISGSDFCLYSAIANHDRVFIVKSFFILTLLPTLAFALPPLPTTDSLEEAFCSFDQVMPPACKEGAEAPSKSAVELNNQVAELVKALPDSGDQLFNEIIALEEVLNRSLPLIEEHFFSPRGNRQPLRMSREAQQAFGAANITEACSPEIIGNSISQLLNAVMMEGKSEEFLRPWELMLQQIASSRSTSRRDRTAVARVLKSIGDFTKRHPSRGPQENSGHSDADPAKHDNRCLSNLFSEFEEFGVVVRNALLFGNRRVPLEQINDVLSSCGGLRNQSKRARTHCVLEALDYSEPEATLELFEQSSMVFLGYSKEDLKFFGRTWNAYPQFFGQQDKLFDVTAVLNADDGAPTNHEYKEDHKIVIFSSPTSGKEESKQNLSRFRSGMPSQCNRHWPRIEQEAQKRMIQDNEFTLLHEFAHSIEARHLNLHGHPLAQKAQEWISLGWENGRPVRAPFQCQRLNEQPKALTTDFSPPQGIPQDCWPFDRQADLLARHHGCISFYGATNPSEDFAESIRFYLTHPDLLRQTSSEKFAFIDELYKGLIQD